MPELMLLVGLPASGKSTFFRQRLTETHLHLSKDLWPNVRRREERLRRILRESLEAGHSVTVDNTNVARAVREPLLHIGREYRARNVGYVFEPDIKACRACNTAREGRAQVAPVGMWVMVSKWEPPVLDEGFDALQGVRLCVEKAASSFSTGLHPNRALLKSYCDDQQLSHERATP